MRKTGQKNVHAFVRGDLDWQSEAGSFMDMSGHGWEHIRYNPYTCDTFVETYSDTPVLKADRVLMDIGRGIWYINECEGRND